MNRLFDAALRLIYPLKAECMGCGDRSGMDAEWICPECRQVLAKNWVGADAPPGAEIDAAAYAYLYRGPAGRMARKLKYNQVRGLAKLMAADMAKAYGFIQPTGAEWAVPVPMHPRRLKKRGFNHAALLADAVGGSLELPRVEALARVRDTVQQAMLEDEARRNNLKDAFAAITDVSGRRVLLVDDVCTTGTTARECARALRDAGASHVYLLCFAIAERKN